MGVQSESAEMRRAELLAEMIVLAVTGMAAVTCFLLCVIAHSSVWFVFVSSYFLALWCLPAAAFFQGLTQRKGKNLLSWIGITFSHEVILLVWSVSQMINNFSSRRHWTASGEFYISCIIISLIPVMVMIILVPSLVYINLERTSPEADLHGEILREYRNLQETTRQRNPNTRDDRLSVIRRKLWQRIVGLTPRFRRYAQTENPPVNRREETREDVTENPAFNREDLAETETDLLPPSYSQIIEDDLPPYNQVVTRNVRLGQKVIILDKNYKISSFKNPN